MKGRLPGAKGQASLQQTLPNPRGQATRTPRYNSLRDHVSICLRKVIDKDGVQCINYHLVGSHHT